MLFNSLPLEIKEKILIFLLPDITWDINSFKNYFLVSKQWNKIFNSYNFRVELSKFLQVFNYYLDKFKTREFLDNFLTYNTMIKYGTIKYIRNFYDENIVDIFECNNLLNLPVCKFRCSKCIDLLCDTHCYINDHNIDDYITSNVMRGVDDKNRPYILFVYKDLDTDKIFYEFIYTIVIKGYKYSTFSGYYNCSYIGMNSYIQHHAPLYFRVLDENCYVYIEKLLGNERCTIPEYCHIQEKFVEGLFGNVTIYF